MKQYGKSLVVTLSLFLSTTALVGLASAEDGAQAEVRKADLGFSVGAGAGVANFDDFDTTQFAWRVQAAYSPCKWIAGEIEWLDLGAPNNKFQLFQPNGSPSGDPAKVEMAASGFNLSVVPVLPLGDDWTLFAKLGGYFWDGNFAGAKGGNWSSDMSFGAGVTYKLFPTFGAGVKAEWTRVMLEVGGQSFSAGSMPSFNDPVDVFTVGAFFLF